MDGGKQWIFIIGAVHHTRHLMNLTLLPILVKFQGFKPQTYDSWRILRKKFNVYTTNPTYISESLDLGVNLIIQYKLFYLILRF